MEEATKDQVMKEVLKIDAYATCEDGEILSYLIIHTFLVDEVRDHLLQEFDNVWETGQVTVTVMISMKGDKNEVS